MFSTVVQLPPLPNPTRNLAGSLQPRCIRCDWSPGSRMVPVALDLPCFPSSALSPHSVIAFRIRRLPRRRWCGILACAAAVHAFVAQTHRCRRQHGDSPLGTRENRKSGRAEAGIRVNCDYFCRPMPFKSRPVIWTPTDGGRTDANGGDSEDEVLRPFVKYSTISVNCLIYTF
jgi:hypothetical protein